MKVPDSDKIASVPVFIPMLEKVASVRKMTRDIIVERVVTK